MSEEKLTGLELRKRLLIAESEINRTLLTREYQTLAGDVHAVSRPISALGILASSAMTLLALSKGSRNLESEANPPKRFRLAGWLFRLGLAFLIGSRGKKAVTNSAEELIHRRHHELSTD